MPLQVPAFPPGPPACCATPPAADRTGAVPHLQRTLRAPHASYRHAPPPRAHAHHCAHARSPTHFRAAHCAHARTRTRLPHMFQFFSTSLGSPPPGTAHSAPRSLLPLPRASRARNTAHLPHRTPAHLPHTYLPRAPRPPTAHTHAYHARPLSFSSLHLPPALPAACAHAYLPFACLQRHRAAHTCLSHLPAYISWHLPPSPVRGPRARTTCHLPAPACLPPPPFYRTTPARRAACNTRTCCHHLVQ